jgi:flap endonuclease-1
MGIYKLMELLRINAADCIKQRDLGYYSGMTIALDASMAMYQFIISTQGYDHNALTSLTDNEGNKTGHLLGIMNRTIALLESGIKPVWVFDGKPPTKKTGEVIRRLIVVAEKKESQRRSHRESRLGKIAWQSIRGSKTTTTHHLHW